MRLFALFSQAEQLPVKKALAESFGVFNKLFTASPTMSWPNHMLTQSGTSCGLSTQLQPPQPCLGILGACSSLPRKKCYLSLPT